MQVFSDKTLQEKNDSPKNVGVLGEICDFGRNSSSKVTVYCRNTLQ